MAAGRSSTPRGPAAELVSPSTCSPRPATIAHHAAGLPIDADQGHGRGKILDATRPGCRAGQPLDMLTTPGDDRSPRGPGCRRLPIDADQVTRPREDPRRHAGRSAGNLVKPSTCSPCGRLPIDADQIDGRGMILDATRPGRRRAGQPLDVLTMPATIAHHAGRPSIDADQVDGRGKILDATRAGCRAGQPLDMLTTGAGCRSTRTRATAAGKILDATRPGCRAGQPLDMLTTGAGCRSTRTR
jgi:hypothetical protein